MCFALQRRALFRHLNFQKWSENGVFCTFWLGNLLRATTVCTFSTSQLPKVLRTKVFLAFSLANYFKKCFEREVFLAFSLANVLRATTACNFSSLIWSAGSAQRACFSTLRSHKTWEKYSVLRLSYLFVHLDLLSSETFSFVIFFLLLFSSLTLPISSFHLSILSEVWLLNFLRLFCTVFHIFSCAQELDICTSLHISAHLRTRYCIMHCSLWPNMSNSCEVSFKILGGVEQCWTVVPNFGWTWLNSGWTVVPYSSIGQSTARSVRRQWIASSRQTSGTGHMNHTPHGAPHGAPDGAPDGASDGAPDGAPASFSKLQ